MGFKERLKEAREQKGYTQTQLGEMVGVTKSAIANYETGVSSAKEQVLIKLMGALGVDANFLWQDEMNIQQKNNLTLSIREQEIIKKYRLLDGNGKRKADEYIDDLVNCGKHNKEKEYNEYSEEIG